MRLLNRLRLNYASGGYIYQAETVTLLRALTGTYSTARKIQIDKLIKSLKASGIWAKLDVFQMYAAPTAADAVVNWKSPGTFNATLVNSPTLEADRGITGDGASSYIRSGFIPSTNGVNYQKDSSGLHIVIKTEVDGVKADAHVYDGTNYINFISRYASTQSIFMLNQTSSTSATIAGTSIGFFQLLRTGATAIARRRNKVETATATTASSNLPTKEVYIGAQNNNGTPAAYSNRQYALFALSSGLTTGETDTFADTVEIYLDFIGAGVIT